MWYSYVGGNFKSTGLMLLSPDGRDDVWMLEGCIENVMLIHLNYYKVIILG
jgi:hypothetical protein